MGTLGVIVEASFKVSPLQPEECLLAVPFPSMEAATAAGRAVLGSPAGPMSYLAVTQGLARHLLSSQQGLSLSQDLGERMGGLGLCFFSGRAGAVARRVEETTAMMIGVGANGVARAESDGALAARSWANDLGWSNDFVPTLALKLSAPRRLVPSLAESCLRIGLLETPSEVLADPGFGTVRVFFWGESDDDGVLEAVTETRRAAQRHGGAAVVEVCHPSIKVRLDVWGEEPGSMAIMNRIKEQFDPQRLLNRGRFLGRL